MTIDVQAGIFKRGLALFGIIDQIKGIPSDEELQGLLSLLPADSQTSIATMLDPEVREAGMPFLNMVREWMFMVRDAKQQGKKIILVPFNFPPDLVLAFDNAVAMTTEVLTTIAALALPGGGERYWEYIQSLGLPDHICSSNSIEVASVLCGLDIKPDAIISAAPGACDANAKIHEFLAHFEDIPQFVLEMPVDDSDQGRQLYSRYFATLIEKLEDFLGEKLQEDRLRDLLEGANRCTDLYWELFEYRKSKPCPVPNIFNVYLASIRFCMWGTPQAIETLEAMVQIAKKRSRLDSTSLPEESVRALWVYTSYYFDVAQLHLWMQNKGWAFLADVLSLYMPQPIDISSKASMIEGLVTTAWEYPMNRQMGTSSMSRSWVEDIVFVAKEMGATCALHCGHDACKQTWSVVSILGEELKKRAGIPLLVLHGDSWMKTTTPISVIQREMEEFVQNVVLRKPKSKRKVRRRAKS